MGPIRQKLACVPKTDYVKEKVNSEKATIDLQRIELPDKLCVRRNFHLLCYYSFACLTADPRRLQYVCAMRAGVYELCMCILCAPARCINHCDALSWPASRPIEIPGFGVKSEKTQRLAHGA